MLKKALEIQIFQNTSWTQAYLVLELEIVIDS